MFEFTEDKKGLRPKYIGTIKHNGIRRTLMVLMTLPTILAVICLNFFYVFSLRNYGVLETYFIRNI